MPKRVQETECLRAVLHYADPAKSYGWSLFPAYLKDGKKKSFLSAKYAPGGANWGATADLGQLRKNFLRYTTAGVGLPTGTVNNLIVVDVDTIKGHGVDGKAALRALEKKHGKLPKTLMAKTPSGSEHYYFRRPDVPFKLKSMTIAAGVDVKADGGMVIAPPSTRPDGKCEWVDPDVAIAPAPDWLIDEIKDEDHQGNGHDPFAEGLYEPLSEDKITEGCEIIATSLPNDDDDWDSWNTKGLKIVAVAPDDRGFAAFDGYSQRSNKYDADVTRDKWNKFHTSPPTKISPGSFIHLVREADPDWSPRGDSDEPAEEWKTKPKTNGATPPTDVGIPIDLWSGSQTSVALPRGLLPSIIEAFAFSHADQKGCDPAGFALGALVACSTVIPDKIKIQPKRNDPGWRQSARFWFGLVGDPSTMKTTIFSETMAPIDRINRKMVIEYMKAMEEWEQLDRDEKRETPKPTKERIKIEDVTVEGVQQIMADSPEGVILCRDELSGYFGGMDRYSGGKRGSASFDRSFYLQAYDGRSYTVDRASADSRHIENLSINIFGGIQSDVIRKVVLEASHDGLIERFNMIMLRSATVGKDVPVSPEAKLYETLIDKLYKLRKRHDDDLVRFDDEAIKVREELEHKHLRWAELTRSSSPRLASHIGKYNGMFARLCLLWHVIEHHEDAWQADIDLDTARRVEAFLHKFLLPHAVTFHFNVLNTSDDHEKLRAIAGYILANDHLETLTSRDIQRGTNSLRGLERKEIERIFDQLDAYKWVDRLPPKRAGGPSHWKVNRQVHEVYHETARREIKRRQEVREWLTEILPQEQGRNSKS